MKKSKVKTNRIILVHGTFSNRKERDAGLMNKPWYQPGSMFRRYLRSSIRQCDSATEIEAFEWSGRNSVTERYQASTRLKMRIEELKTVGRIGRIIVICHSHGGTIAADAIERTRHKDQVFLCCIATPFIKVIDHEDKSDAPTWTFQLFVGLLAAIILHFDFVPKIVVALESIGINRLPYVSEVLLFTFIFAPATKFADWLNVRLYNGFFRRSAAERNAFKSVSTLTFEKSDAYVRDTPTSEALCIREPSDEASGLLSSSVFLHTIANWFLIPTSIFFLILPLLMLVEGFGGIHLASGRLFFFVSAVTISCLLLLFLSRRPFGSEFYDLKLRYELDVSNGPSSSFLTRELLVPAKRLPDQTIIRGIEIREPGSKNYRNADHLEVNHIVDLLEHRDTEFFEIPEGKTERFERFNVDGYHYRIHIIKFFKPLRHSSHQRTDICRMVGLWVNSTIAEHP